MRSATYTANLEYLSDHVCVFFFKWPQVLLHLYCSGVTFATAVTHQVHGCYTSMVTLIEANATSTACCFCNFQCHGCFSSSHCYHAWGLFHSQPSSKEATFNLQPELGTVAGWAPRVGQASLRGRLAWEGGCGAGNFFGRLRAGSEHWQGWIALDGAAQRSHTSVEEKLG